MGNLYKCELCGKEFSSLFIFASHLAKEHKVSAITYWSIYGHYGDKGNEKINPSRRISSE